MGTILWIFGWVTGIANACAFGEAHGSHGNSESVPHGHHLTPVIEAHHHDDLGGVESAHQAQDPACQKFCEDGRSMLNQTLKGFGGVADLMPVLRQAPVLARTSADVSHRGLPAAGRRFLAVVERLARSVPRAAPGQPGERRPLRKGPASAVRGLHADPVGLLAAMADASDLADVPRAAGDVRAPGALGGARDGAAVRPQHLRYAQQTPRFFPRRSASPTPPSREA